MHHADELTREKDEGEQHTSPPDNDDVPSTESETGSDGLPSTGEVVIVNFEAGEPADPHNWSIVSTDTHEQYRSSMLTASPL